MTKARDDLSVEYVRSALRYDPETGILYWRHRTDMEPQWNGKFPGRRAGTVNDRGYIIVAIYQRDFRAHRLIWAIMTGEWPREEIDHENLVKSDNRWANLRQSTHAQNSHNRPALATNKCGLKGVSFCKLTKSWVARLKIGQKHVVLGRAANPETAHELYRQAASVHHGEFFNASSRS